MTDTSPALDAALAYAARGWRVIPIAPGGKHPHVQAWQNAATTDTSLIHDLWGRWPGHGVGIATGATSAVFVLDVDVANGKHGDDTLADLENTHGRLPDTVETVTGTGGRHLYFAYPDGLEIRNDQAGRLGPGLDIRGEGGQVLAPPTIHPNGQPYVWEASSDPDDVPVAPAPVWLLDLLTSAPAGQPDRERKVKIAERSDLPGDWFESYYSWPDLLERDGATFLDARTDRQTGKRYELWSRPPLGDEPGFTPHTSASLGYMGSDVLKVFTSSWAGVNPSTGEITWKLDQDATYTRFGYYAARHHHGDHRAAAGSAAGLRRQATGYDELDGLLSDNLTGAAPAVPPVPLVAPSEPRAVDELTVDEKMAHRLVPGGTFILDAPEQVPIIWGRGDEVLWSKGEPLFLAAPPGVGKTTLAGQIVAGLVGTLTDVLGYPIDRATGKVLYLASDRPNQIQRSLRRLFGPEHRQMLDDKLVVWKGPPPADIAADPGILLRLAELAGASVVVLDSLKDMAVGLSDDETGAKVNRSIQELIADDIDVLVLHHQRKGQGGEKPKKLEDVYGSTWITAGAGSVILLWGAAGDLVVDLVHLKQPAAEVGPLRIEHDHVRGLSSVSRGFDPLRLLRSARNGVTTLDVARAMLEKTNPNENERKKAQRKLDQLVAKGLARKTEANVGGGGGSQPAKYYPTDALDGLISEASGAPDTASFPDPPLSGEDEHQTATSIRRIPAVQSTLHPTRHTPDRQAPSTSPSLEKGNGGCPPNPQLPTGPKEAENGGENDPADDPIEAPSNPPRDRAPDIPDDPYADLI